MFLRQVWEWHLKQCLRKASGNNFFASIRWHPGPDCPKVTWRDSDSVAFSHLLRWSALNVAAIVIAKESGVAPPPSDRQHWCRLLLNNDAPNQALSVCETTQRSGNRVDVRVLSSLLCSWKRLGREMLGLVVVECNSTYARRVKQKFPDKDCCCRNIFPSTVATSPVVLRWLCDSPRTGCARRTTPYIYVARTSNNRMIVACNLWWYQRCERNNSVRGEWSWHVNSIVPCCHSAKLCACAARDFRSQQPSEWRTFSISPLSYEWATIA